MQVNSIYSGTPLYGHSLNTDTAPECYELCTYWLSGRAGRENIWLEVMAHGASAMTEGQIFSRPARPNSVNKYFIIWPLLGLLQQQNCRKLHLAGPYANLAGPYGFFRPCSRYRARPSYRDIAIGLLLKARAGPYGSYDKVSFRSRRKAHTFSLKLTRLIWTPVNTDNGHFSVSLVTKCHIVNPALWTLSEYFTSENRTEKANSLSN